MSVATIAPTYGNRVFSLDVLRGFAVLGILLANIAWFGHPMLAEPISNFEGLPGSQPWISALMTTCVNGKFRGLLAMLFAVGLYLQYRKRKAMWCPPPPLPGERPKRNPYWPGPYVRRMLILGGIGLAHGLFLWYGDILFSYAMTALVAILFVEVSESKLKWWLVGLGVVNLLIALGLSALYLVWGTMAANGGGIEFLGFTELEAFAHGNYGQQLLYRAVFLPIMVFTMPLILISTLFAFLFGLYVAKSGFLDNPDSRPDVFRFGLLVCLLLGLPLNLLGGYGVYVGWVFDITFMVEMFAAPLLSIGVLVLGIKLLRSSRSWLLQPFAKVGKVALSAYLMQTVICTFVFYSWGLGWFGLMTVQQLLTVVVAVWAAVIVMAYAWLRFFDIGPAEWAWRSMSDKRKLPWRGSSGGM